MREEWWRSEVTGDIQESESEWAKHVIPHPLQLLSPFLNFYLQQNSPRKLFILFVLRSASSLSWNHSNQMFTHKIPLKLLSRLLVNCMLNLMDHSLSLASSLCTSICQLITPPFLSSRTLYPSVFWLLQWLLLLGLHSSSCLWPKYWRTQILFWISPLYILTLGCPIHIYVDSFQIYLSIADLFLNSKWIYATA